MNQNNGKQPGDHHYYTPVLQIPVQVAQQITMYTHSTALPSTTDGFAQPDAPLFNLQKLETISGGDKSFIAMMASIFTSSTPPMLFELQHAAEFSNWHEVAMVSHKLKSTVDTMGIDRASTIIREIEHHARFADETSLIADKTTSFINTVNQSIVQMQQWLDENDL